MKKICILPPRLPPGRSPSRIMSRFLISVTWKQYLNIPVNSDVNECWIFSSSSFRLPGLDQCALGSRIALGAQVNPRSILRVEPLHHCIDTQLAHEEVVWHCDVESVPSHSSRLPLVLSPLHPDELLDSVSDCGCRVVAVGAEIGRCCLVIHGSFFMKSWMSTHPASSHLSPGKYLW